MLKRSSFKRPRYEPPEPAPLRPLTRPVVVWKPSEVVVAVPKFVYFRSLPYRMWVASTPCRRCGIEKQGQCAHSNQAKHGKGDKIKAGDQYTFCLCVTRPGFMGCHMENDLLLNGLTKEQRDADEERFIAETWELARAAGWPVHEWEAA